MKNQFTMHGGYRIPDEFEEFIKSKDIETQKKIFKALYSERVTMTSDVHNKTSYDESDGYLYCNFSGETVEEMSYGDKDKKMYVAELLEAQMEPEEFDAFITGLYYEDYAFGECKSSDFLPLTLLHSDSKKVEFFNRFNYYMDGYNKQRMKIVPPVGHSPIDYLYQVLPSLNSRDIQKEWVSQIIKGKNIEFGYLGYPDKIDEDQLINMLTEGYNYRRNVSREGLRKEEIFTKRVDFETEKDSIRTARLASLPEEERIFREREAAFKANTGLDLDSNQAEMLKQRILGELVATRDKTKIQETRNNIDRRYNDFIASRNNRETAQRQALEWGAAFNFDRNSKWNDYESKRELHESKNEDTIANMASMGMEISPEQKVQLDRYPSYDQEQQFPNPNRMNPETAKLFEKYYGEEDSSRQK